MTIFRSKLKNCWLGLASILSACGGSTNIVNAAQDEPEYDGYVGHLEMSPVVLSCLRRDFGNVASPQHGDTALDPVLTPYGAEARLMSDWFYIFPVRDRNALATAILDRDRLACVREARLRTLAGRICLGEPVIEHIKMDHYVILRDAGPVNLRNIVLFKDHGLQFTAKGPKERTVSELIELADLFVSRRNLMLGAGA